MNDGGPAFVQAKCIGCGEKRGIHASDVPRGEHPCCERCGMPMIAEKAKGQAREKSE